MAKWTVPEVFTRAELDAAVAATLELVVNRVNGCDRVSEVQPTIRALDNPEARAQIIEAAKGRG